MKHSKSKQEVVAILHRSDKHNLCTFYLVPEIYNDRVPESKVRLAYVNIMDIGDEYSVYHTFYFKVKDYDTFCSNYYSLYSNQESSLMDTALYVSKYREVGVTIIIDKHIDKDRFNKQVTALSKVNKVL